MFAKSDSFDDGLLDYDRHRVKVDQDPQGGGDECGGPSSAAMVLEFVVELPSHAQDQLRLLPFANPNRENARVAAASWG